MAELVSLGGCRAWAGALKVGVDPGTANIAVVVLDENDQVIRPAILWNDGRTFRENDYLNQVIGKEKLSEYTANISFTGFTAPKILWMKILVK